MIKNSFDQMNLGYILMLVASRCYDLTAAVPAEFEDDMWKAGEAAIDAAALFGEPSAIYEIERVAAVPKQMCMDIDI